LIASVSHFDAFNLMQIILFLTKKVVNIRIKMQAAFGKDNKYGLLAQRML